MGEMDRRLCAAFKEMGYDGIHMKMRWWRANHDKERGEHYYFSFPREWPPRMAHKNKHGWCVEVRSPFSRAL